MELLRCKACGYVINSKKLRDICPACGVPKSAFETYKENISSRRKLILGLNLHPIAVHFPQAFAIVISAFIIFDMLFNPSFGFNLMITVKVLSIILPLTVLAALCCGIIDGKTRFKKLSTPILIKKIAIGSTLLMVSIAVAYIALFYDIEIKLKISLLLLSGGCVICEILLAELGKTLMNAKLQG